MKRIFYYLLAFSLLYNIFQYVNATKIFRGMEKEFESTHQKLQKAKDSIQTLNQTLIDKTYFSLDLNEQAQTYFSQENFEEQIHQIEQEIMALNHQVKGNPLVPYAPINGQKCIINKVSFLNHRWIVADFYSGSVRGELLIQYFLHEDQPTEFQTLETVLYPSRE